MTKIIFFFHVLVIFLGTPLGWSEEEVSVGANVPIILGAKIPSAHEFAQTIIRAWDLHQQETEDTLGAERQSEVSPELRPFTGDKLWFFWSGPGRLPPAEIQALFRVLEHEKHRRERRGVYAPHQIKFLQVAPEDMAEASAAAARELRGHLTSSVQFVDQMQEARSSRSSNQRRIKSRVRAIVDAARVTALHSLGLDRYDGFFSRARRHRLSWDQHTKFTLLTTGFLITINAVAAYRLLRPTLGDRLETTLMIQSLGTLFLNLAQKVTLDWKNQGSRYQPDAETITLEGPSRSIEARPGQFLSSRIFSMLAPLVCHSIPFRATVSWTGTPPMFISWHDFIFSVAGSLWHGMKTSFKSSASKIFPEFMIDLRRRREIQEEHARRTDLQNASADPKGGFFWARSAYLYNILGVVSGVAVFLDQWSFSGNLRSVMLALSALGLGSEFLKERALRMDQIRGLAWRLGSFLGWTTHPAQRCELGLIASPPRIEYQQGPSSDSVEVPGSL